ncbi:hypothetical protein [Bacillus marasmi]|uniref:hypothetical protein n=1 Tax=Bacillus marasmi TaxID=1926279 RepID=UPI0011C7B165|nr:hypothetical protein [Bacillus marasmi]
MTTTLIAPPLGNNEKYLLDEYLGTREPREGLYQLIQNRRERIPRLYRGIMYLLEDVTVGHIYSHWDLASSWSIDEQVATQFALAEYVPEDIIDKMVRNKKLSIKDYHDQFVPIVLYCDNVKGFVVNHHYKDHLYAKENEVIVYNTKCKITLIEDAFYESKRYYKVYCHSLD